MKLIARTVAAVVVFLALPAMAQELGESRVDVTARFEPAIAAPGAGVELVVTVTPALGYHVYGNKERIGTPTTLSITDAKGLVVVGSAVVPDGDRHSANGMTSYWLGSTFDLKQRLSVPASVKPGEVEIQFKLDYMACTEEMCDPPGSATGSAKLRVALDAPSSPASAAAAGQDPPAPTVFADDRVTVEARLHPPRVQANGTTTLVLRVTPAFGWHVYGTKEEIGQPIQFSAVTGPGVTVQGAPKVPEGKEHKLGSLTTYWLGEPFEMRQDVRVAKGTPPGVIDVKVKVGYTACTESACDLPTAIEGGVQLVVTAGEAPDPVTDTFKKELPTAGGGPEEGLLGFLLAAIGWGLFALAMPCTYPMIPITISFFTKQAEKRGGNALSLALIYGLGIVLMFVLIGVAIGVPIQTFATHPLTNLVFAAVFLVFALSLFGLFNLEPPQWAMNLAGQASGRGGYSGVFLMGATLVITSFTCTAPFVGSLLGASAGYGLGWIVLGMGVFGLTMAVPFVLLSLLPGRARALPRGGEWMDVLKVFLGFVEVAAALKFISNADLVWHWSALPRDLFLWLWAGIFGVASMYLFGQIRLKGHDGNIGPGRLVSGLATALFAIYCLFGALGSPLDRIMTGIAPNYSSTVVGSTGGRGAALQPKHVIVKDDHEGALKVAAEQGKLVLMNLTGHT